MQVLKEKTRPLHVRVEHALDISSRLSSKENYEQLLSDFYGLYAPLEKCLQEVPHLSGPTYDFAVSHKVELLSNDLAAMGFSSGEIANLPLCEWLIDLTSTPRAFGCLYVLEGAALGGQIIAAEVRRRLSLTAENGLSFFTGAGEQTSLAWNAFRQHLTKYAAAHPGCDAEVLESAEETFLMFERWLLRN